MFFSAPDKLKSSVVGIQGSCQLCHIQPLWQSISSSGVRACMVLWRLCLVCAFDTWIVVWGWFPQAPWSCCLTLLGLLPGSLEMIHTMLLGFLCSCLWLPPVDTGLPYFALVCLELAWHGVFWPFFCSGCLVVSSWWLVVRSFCLAALSWFLTAWSWLLFHEVATELNGASVELNGAGVGLNGLVSDILELGAELLPDRLEFLQSSLDTSYRLVGYWSSEVGSWLLWVKISGSLPGLDAGLPWIGEELARLMLIGPDLVPYSPEVAAWLQEFPGFSWLSVAWSGFLRFLWF